MVPRLPAPTVHLDGGVEVLGDGLGGHTPHLRQGVAPDDSSRAAPEDTVVAILAGQDDLEEHALVMSSRLEVLERVLVAEVLRCLDQRHLGIVEVAHGGIQDVGLGHVVGVEYQEQVAVGTMRRAWLMFPALAWLLSGRVT